MQVLTQHELEAVSGGGKHHHHHHHHHGYYWGCYPAPAPIPVVGIAVVEYPRFYGFRVC
ncbi:hypothetical protein [Neisseria sp. oral taxon 014]|uniref:hypothetical protein n=1 Tax=Neisseria sp. oral taxon 014 TaxID=641148 RepID=UPI0025CFF29F|nr:hypothetical protein [Neisseria sp. oral taxon 014]